MTAAHAKRAWRVGISLVCGVLVLVSLLMPGCRKEKEETYALVPKSIGQIYWEACQRGMEKAAEEEGINGYFTGPPTTDIAKQIDIIENLILQGVKGIGLSPNDPTAVKDVIARAVKRGIPVVTFDSDAPESQRMAYIGTDNKGAGKVAGETLAKIMEGKGEFAILTGGLGAHNLNLRIEGFREAIKNYPEMKEIALEPDDDDSEKATAIAENLLISHPNLAGFFGVSAPGAPGAARAVKDANKVGKVIIVGFDDTPECRAYIKEGVIQATIAQRPFDMGYRAIKVLVEANKGNKPKEEIIDTGVLVITKDNLKETEQKY